MALGYVVMELKLACLRIKEGNCLGRQRLSLGIPVILLDVTKTANLTIDWKRAGMFAFVGDYVNKAQGRMRMKLVFFYFFF